MGLIDIEDDDGVRVITMLDVEHANALTPAMARALETAMQAPQSVRAIVLRGRGECFSRGASEDVLRGLHAGDIAPAELTLPRALLGADVPVIAAMEGHAIGGGFVLGLAADMVLLARESRYGATFMDLGFTPGMGATCLLERAMSPVQAYEMLLGAEPKRGATLSGHGFNAVLPRAEVWPRALELASRLADKPRRALVLLKDALAGPWRERFEAAHAHEARMHTTCFAEGTAHHAR
ncbi:MAG: polyketide synthase [Nannocystaceae bacterium]|nr:polyketide synthase [bacterium]